MGQRNGLEMQGNDQFGWPSFMGLFVGENQSSTPHNMAKHGFSSLMESW